MTTEIAPTQQAEIADFLSGQRPADMDAAALSRAASHGVRLSVRTETRFPSGPNGERLPAYDVVTGCTVVDAVPDVDPAEVLAEVEKFTTPAPVEQIEGWLAELSVVVMKRNEDDFTETLRAEAYSSRLARYPADVARAAILEHSWKFWPTWYELERVCNRLNGGRQAMVAALKRFEPTEPEPPRERVSKDSAEAILREHGFTPRRFGIAAKKRMMTHDDLKAGGAEPHQGPPSPPPSWQNNAALEATRVANPMIAAAREAAQREAQQDDEEGAA